MGKSSPGIINVVVFGPKFWKKFAKQYKAKNAFKPLRVSTRTLYAPASAATRSEGKVENLVRGRLTHYDEDDGKHRKPHVLDGFSANPIYAKDRKKVSRQGGGDEDEVSNRYPFQVVNHFLQYIAKGAGVKIHRIYG